MTPTAGGLVQRTALGRYTAAVSTSAAVNDLSDDELRARLAELQTEHRAVIARRPTVPLGSEEYVEVQKHLAGIEVRMNEISGILAERAGRGFIAIRGRD